MFGQRSHSTLTSISVKFAVAMLFVAVAVTLASAPARAVPTAAIFTVNSNSDAGDAVINGICETGNGNGVCTLRAAVMEADATSGATINFSLPGSITYLLTLGELNITANLSIVGNGSTNTIIDGDANSRVFDVSSSNLLVNISKVMIQNGSTNQGAGIYNAGNLWLNDSSVINNTANTGSDPKVGGGIYNTGVLTVTNSFINHNSAPLVSFTGGGGGIYNAGGTVLLLDTTMDSNSTNFLGGAIQVDGGTVSLLNSMINSNTAANGGGIFNGGLAGSGTLNISNSGIYSNTAFSTSGGGGGIFNHSGPVTLINSTLFLNAANRDGGGIYNDDGYGSTTRLYNATVALNFADYDHDQVGAGGGMTGTITFRNSILASNLNVNGICISCTSPDDCGGTFNSEDFNLIQTTTGCTFIGSTANNITGVDPQFNYPIAFNSGPTLNLALFPYSPAVNAGNTGGCRDGLGAYISTDQRGFIRPFPTGGRCDIGAYEFGWTLFLPLVVK